MKPVFFDSCLGWLHPGASSRGVVLCGPLGREGDFTYRSWRRLAEMLSAAGLPTLRFDYRGFGDSVEEDDAPDRIAAWVGDVRQAAQWLKATQGVQEVVLVGLRFGAAAAAAAAGELGGVQGLAFLAPVTSGRAYHRELTIMARMGQKAPPREGEDLNVAGITCTPQTQTDLQQFEPFRAGGLLAPRILTLTPPGMKLDRVLAGRLAGSDIDAREGEFTGYSDLMVDADFAAFPEEAFARIVDWTREGLPPAPAAATVSGVNEEVQIDLTCARERTVFLNGSSRLFAIVTEPKTRAKGGGAVVFLNTGATRHTGTGRIAVLLARRFAELGLTSLRFDLAGVGDSPDRAGQRDPVEHIADGFPDVAAALDWLESEGYSNPLLLGFCRGAQLACNMAFRDRRVRAQILIAPPPYFWNDEPAHRAPISNRRYLNLVATPKAWKRFANGEISPLQLMRIGARMLGRVVSKARAKVVADGVAKRLRSLKGLGVETLLLYGDSDEFLIDNEEYFSAGRKEFENRLGMTTAILSDVDHLFLEKRQRQILTDAILRYFSEGLRLIPNQAGRANTPPLVEGAAPYAAPDSSKLSPLRQH
ncbi:MAG TPA: alpha/beta fold hydrolase [Caulobacteraceae bacterium]